MWVRESRGVVQACLFLQLYRGKECICTKGPNAMALEPRQMLSHVDCKQMPKWGSIVHSRKENSAIPHSWTWGPLLLAWTLPPHRIIAGCLCYPLSTMPWAWQCPDIYILTKARWAVKERRFGFSPTWHGFTFKVFCKENGDLSRE